MKAPDDKVIAMLFASHPARNLKWRWYARLTFPAGATAETVLPIEVTDGDGMPIESAVFAFAGKRLKVKDGKTSLTFAEFIAGKHEKDLWMHRPGIMPMPGGLSFG